jgi:dihydrolipoamide dehydrogenase
MAYDLVVIGAGPGGYTAAFRAADLGLRVALIDKNNVLGGVCLNVGCIPSKAFLHAAKVIDDSKEASLAGIDFTSPVINLEKMKHWKNSVIDELAKGLKGLAKQRKVECFQGQATFKSEQTIEIALENDQQEIQFSNAIIAVGSEPAALDFLPDDPRIIDSTGALEPKEIPNTILIIGGGIIGLEMATIYSALGSKVTIIELLDQLMPGTDKDLVKPLERQLEKKCEAIYKSSKVIKAEANQNGISVVLEINHQQQQQIFDQVLVAVGRKANGNKIKAEDIGVDVNDNGTINVDGQMRTNRRNIFAIGDVVGDPMLAHKASHEGKIAAEVIAGQKSVMDIRCIPSVAYTDPEVAWVGLTENECKNLNIDYKKGVFPWSASGRALTIAKNEGLTKLLFDPKTKRVIGGGIVGTNSGDLISEIALAIEMDCDVSDIALTIHPHPTLSETVALAAEVFEGTVTDLYLKN